MADECCSRKRVRLQIFQFDNKTVGPCGPYSCWTLATSTNRIKCHTIKRSGRIAHVYRNIQIARETFKDSIAIETILENPNSGVPFGTRTTSTVLVQQSYCCWPFNDQFTFRNRFSLFCLSSKVVCKWSKSLAKVQVDADFTRGFSSIIRLIDSNVTECSRSLRSTEC